MGTSLRDSGAIEVEQSFLPESEALFAELVQSIAWDGRIRARKAASFGLPYGFVTN